MAVKYKIDKKDMSNWLKVVIYSGVASFLGIIVANLANIDIPAQYGFIVPIINTILVAAKDFFENRMQ